MATRPDLKEYGLNFNREKPDYAKQVWSMAIMFFALGIFMLIMLLYLSDMDPVRYLMLIVMTGMLFFGSAAYVYIFWKMNSPEDEESREANFRCRHCGKGFASERIWKKHEMTCIKMKI